MYRGEEGGGFSVLNFAFSKLGENAPDEAYFDGIIFALMPKRL